MRRHPVAQVFGAAQHDAGEVLGGLAVRDLTRSSQNSSSRYGPVTYCVAPGMHVADIARVSAVAAARVIRGTLDEQHLAPASAALIAAHSAAFPPPMTRTSGGLSRASRWHGQQFAHSRRHRGFSRTPARRAPGCADPHPHTPPGGHRLSRDLSMTSRLTVRCHRTRGSEHRQTPAPDSARTDGAVLKC